MLGSKSISSSWADEVEKEDEEDTRIRHRKREKPNPFGSARPREEVLDERGIDWRNLDRNDPQDSLPRKEKRKVESMSPGRAKRPIPPFPSSSAAFEGSGDTFVPSLRYPPKNMLKLLQEEQWSSNSYRAEPREDRIREAGMRKSMESNRMESNFRSSPGYRAFDHGRGSGWDKEESGRSFAVRDLGRQEIGEMRNVRSSSGHHGKEWENTNFNPNGRHLFEDRVPDSIPVRGRRGEADEEWGEMGNKYRRMSGFGESLRRTPPIDVLPNDERFRYGLNKEVGFGGNHRDVGVRPLEERERVEGRERFDVKEFEAPRTGRMDRGRAEDERHRFGAREFEDHWAGSTDRGRAENGRERSHAREFEGHHAGRVDRGRADDRRGRFDKDFEDPFGGRGHRGRSEDGRQRFRSREFEGPRTGRVDREKAADHHERDMEKADFGRSNRKRLNTSHDHHWQRK